MKPWPLLALLGTACLHPDHSVVGKQCADDAACGDAQLVCVAQRCSSPVEALENLVPNGDMNDGLAGWSAASDSRITLAITAEGRDGGPAMRVSYDGGSSSYLSVQLDPTAIVFDGGAPAVCGEAWVQRGSLGVPFTLTLRSFQDADHWKDAQGDSVLPPGDAWVRVSAEILPSPPDDQELNLRIHAPAPSGAAFYLFDDVRVWPRPDAGCP